MRLISSWEFLIALGQPDDKHLYHDDKEGILLSNYQGSTNQIPLDLPYEAEVTPARRSRSVSNAGSHVWLRISIPSAETRWKEFADELDPKLHN